MHAHCFLFTVHCLLTQREFGQWEIDTLVILGCALIKRHGGDWLDEVHLLIK